MEASPTSRVQSSPGVTVDKSTPAGAYERNVAGTPVVAGTTAVDTTPHSQADNDVIRAENKMAGFRATVETHLAAIESHIRNDVSSVSDAVRNEVSELRAKL